MKIRISDIDCRNGFSEDPVVVIGAGSVGMKLVKELLQLNPNQPVVIFNEEPFIPYDRKGLSSFLAGSRKREDLNNQISHDYLVQHNNRKVIDINRANQYVIDEIGKRHYYSKLVIATGSRPHIPRIPGVNLPHVYTFRDMSDVEALIARRVKSRCIVVIGGGLLGLETALAMQKNSTQVVIVSHTVRLMSKQLNDEISEELHREITSHGISVYLNVAVSSIEGSQCVTGVHLSDGICIKCDTVIITAGVVPNRDLALTAGLIVGRGIKVNDSLLTSDPNIFAIGECSEFNGDIYGLSAPGLEQATVVANILHGNKSKHSGSVNITKLTLLEKPVYSAGVVADAADDLYFSKVKYKNNNVIRILILRHRRVIGAMGIGIWHEFEKLQEAIRNQRRIWPWQLWSFSRTGRIWTRRDEFNVSNWPANKAVCFCKDICRDQIDQCAIQDFNSVEQVYRETSSSTVCGLCQPLLEDLVQKNQNETQYRLHKTIFLSSLFLMFLLGIWYFLFIDISVLNEWHSSIVFGHHVTSIQYV